MLTFLNYLTKSSIQLEFVAGTLTAASEAALITISLTEILEEECLLSLARRARRLSTET